MQLLIERIDEIKSLSTPDDKNTLIIYCSKSNVSKLSGQNKRNKYRFMREFGFLRVIFRENPELSEFEAICHIDFKG